MRGGLVHEKDHRLESLVAQSTAGIGGRAGDGVQAEFPQGICGSGLSLVDNGSQPTASGFVAALSRLGIEHIFTSYDNPKGHAETERLMRTIKEELLWLREFHTLEEAREAIAQWITVDDNQQYAHSAFRYRRPVEFEAALREQGSVQTAA
ncbi:MAG: hypothetical protein D6690_02295 [Nitrospirae bacterium]|nr:MAG: hypothetical protein D6690_02295 [Nitrospirota bacterium]